MKRTALLCLLLLFLLGGQARAANVRMEVTVNGRSLGGDPFLKDGVTYVRLVPLLEALGGWEAVWNGAERTVSSETDLFTLTVPIGSRQVLVNDIPYDLNGPAILKDSRTYVPLRSLAGLLGANVNYVNRTAPVTVTSRKAMDYTEEDLYWLSRVISAESQGECLRGQIAVGNVVLNRVASADYPSTIQEVVFDQRDAVQFTPTENGTIYQEPTAQSVLAARLVLSGANAVEDCMFFFCPDLSKGTWIRENRTYYTTIGCHRFYR